MTRVVHTQDRSGRGLRKTITFAGIPNPLFAADNTLMYFAGGKKAILDLTNAIQGADEPP
jgi:NAD/NADP transhydrogenase beta subunit